MTEVVGKRSRDPEAERSPGILGVSPRGFGGLEAGCQRRRSNGIVSDLEFRIQTCSLGNPPAQAKSFTRLSFSTFVFGRDGSPQLT